jgi:hypothetical protein
LRVAQFNLIFQLVYVVRDAAEAIENGINTGACNAKHVVKKSSFPRAATWRRYTASNI